MQYENNLVSIIMPNRNGAVFIAQAIESVIAQTCENWELLIADGASTDNSAEIILEYQKKDSRVRPLLCSRQMNAAEARNEAIRHAGGRFLAFLDSDDVWAPRKLEVQLQFMEKHACAFSCSDYAAIDRNGTQTGRHIIRKDILRYADILKSNSIGCLTVMIDRAAIPDVRMCEESEIREDMACWLQILKSGCNALVCHECLASYRRHNNSASNNKYRMTLCQWNLYRRIEKITFIRSVCYMLCWALSGIRKYKD